MNSVNASSIKGAFGYVLGEIDESANLVVFWPNMISSHKYFKPNKILPGFKKFLIDTTISDKKVYGIRAFNYGEEFIGCRESQDFPNKLYTTLNMLEAKYGKFKHTKDVYTIDTYGLTVTLSDITEHQEFIFDDGNRSISLSCSQEPKQGFSFRLSYIDKKLERQFEKEKQEMIKAKELEDAADYDL
jgi:hypothetical protein